MFSPIEIAAVVGVAILVFGADKLPKLARALCPTGQFHA